MPVNILPDQRITLFVNPFSEKASEVANTLSKLLSKANINFAQEWPDDLSTTNEAWIVGGDGTINYFLNKYHAPSVPLAFFKAGTGNDIHWKLYGDVELDEQFRKVMAAELKTIDCATCNDMFYINSSGLGFDGEVLRSMDTIRWMGGHLGYLFVVIRKILSFREYHFEITEGDDNITGKFLLVAVNNSSRTGGGFKVTPDASLTDGKLDLLLCKPLSVFQRLRYLPRVEKGKHLTLPQVEYRQVSSVTIHCEQNIYAQLDGELISGRSFVFNTLAGRLHVRF